MTLSRNASLMRRSFVLSTLAIITALSYTTHLDLAFAGEPKPVPKMQAIPLPHDEISFQRDGVELTRYCFSKDQQRPFLFPINGPSGRSLTRMGHPHDPETHSHHNSVWISHQNVDGLNFWEDHRGGTIVHQKILRFEDDPEEAYVETENAWAGKDGKVLLRELRRTTVRDLPSGEWFLEIDLHFEPKTAQTVTLGQTAFGLIGVRMAKTIGVNDGGGTIRNSEGGVDEAGCFRKPARWVDYSGPVTATATEGLTLMDHPMNPGHPTAFHVRNDGWMGAALTFAGPLEIKPETPLEVRYGLYVHAGMPSPDVINKQWSAFSARPFRPFTKGR